VIVKQIEFTSDATKAQTFEGLVKPLNFKPCGNFFIDVSLKVLLKSVELTYSISKLNSNSPKWWQFITHLVG